MNALPVQMVGHLIVVLDIKDKRVRRFVFYHRSSRLLLPVVALPLIDESPLDDGKQLLGGPPIIGKIGLAPPGHGEALLTKHRPAIELLRLSLHDLESPYAHVLDALAECLPALSVTERGEVARLAREGPPEEAVGLEPYGPPEAMPANPRPAGSASLGVFAQGAKLRGTSG